MIESIQSYMPLVGRDALETAFMKSVEPLQVLVGILEGDLFDAGISKLATIRSWLQAVSFDLFLLIWDIHLEHSFQKPHTIPKGQPMAALLTDSKATEEVDPLYF